MSGQWVTVSEAVQIFDCLGLSRDIKTIRRWAQRSQSRPENAEVLVHEQDSRTGLRYVIERGSLARKVAQELAFEADRAEAHMSEQGHARPGVPADRSDEGTTDSQDRTDPDLPAPVLPDLDMSGDNADPEVRKLSVSTVADGFLKDQIAPKDAQIAQLNAQIERKDEQIMAMLERNRETNILIHTLQKTLSQSIGNGTPDQTALRVGDDGDRGFDADTRSEV